MMDWYIFSMQPTIETIAVKFLGGHRWNPNWPWHYKTNLYLLNRSITISPLCNSLVPYGSPRPDHHGRILVFSAIPNWGLLEVSFPRDWSHWALWALERHSQRTATLSFTEKWLQLWYAIKSRCWECRNPSPTVNRSIYAYIHPLLNHVFSSLNMNSWFWHLDPPSFLV